MKRTLTALVVATLSVALVPAAAGAAAPKKVATRSEVAQVVEGMTRTKVEKILGAGPGCAYPPFKIGTATYSTREYPQANGKVTVVKYDDATDGKVRAGGRSDFAVYNAKRMCS